MVGEVIIGNCVIDHRYIDGGKAKGIVSKMKRVFEVPEDYMTGGKSIATD